MEFIKVKDEIVRIGEIANVSLQKGWARIQITLRNGNEIKVFYKDPYATRMDPNKDEKDMAEKEFNAIWDLLQKREA